jgi:hypothetical protein
MDAMPDGARLTLRTANVRAADRPEQLAPRTLSRSRLTRQAAELLFRADSLARPRLVSELPTRAKHHKNQDLADVQRRMERTDRAVINLLRRLGVYPSLATR